MISVAALAVTLFFGGWLRPFPNVAWLGFLDLVPAVLWFSFKVFHLSLCIYLDPGNSSSLPLRPVDAIRVENLSPPRPGQCHGVGRSDLVVDVNMVRELS